MPPRRAIVIGSGPNGLAAAITLARAGLDVLVCEAAGRPGGGLATEELTLPGFRHDTFSAVHPAAAASPVFAGMPLAEHGLRWVHPEACHAHPLADGRGAALYRDPLRTADSLDRLCAGDGERWLELIGPLLGRFHALRATLLSGFPPLAGAVRTVAGLGTVGALELARVALAPATALAGELFAGSGARAWLYGSALHGDVPLSAAGSAVTAVYLNLLGHGVGWPSPQGGAGALAAALVSYLEALGGAVRTSAEVVAVLRADGRGGVSGVSGVSGVRLAGGERVAADLVVADVMPAALVRLAGELLPGRYVRALLRYRMGPATLKVDWALAGPIPWDSEEARQAGTVHVGGDEDDLLGRGDGGGERGGGERGGGEHGSGEHGGLTARPFVLLGQQTVADATRAPAGRHTAWAYTHGPAGADWTGQRDAHVQRIEAQVERFAPGFRALILARHVMAPGDLERRNANLVAGDTGGGSLALDQLVFRPVPALVPYRTPLRGLWLGSAATFPGGAVHGVAGSAAARYALAEARIRRLLPG